MSSNTGGQKGSLHGAASRGVSKKNTDPILEKHLRDTGAQDTVRINVKMPREMRTAVNAKAEERGETVSDVVRAYLEHYLEQ